MGVSSVSSNRLGVTVRAGRLPERSAPRFRGGHVPSPRWSPFPRPVAAGEGSQVAGVAFHLRQEASGTGAAGAGAGSAGSPAVRSARIVL